MPGKSNSDRRYDRIFSELYGTPWLISEEWMMTIIEIAQRQVDFDAVAARKGKYMENAERAKMFGSSAVIPISGPIFPKSNIMTDFSGATSIELLARDLEVAVKDDSIGRIILDIDSPGGHVTGVNEMANMIRSFSDKKDIISYVSGTGASAAYWLASAGSEIVLDATSRVGSIGVVVAYPKPDADTVEIVNSSSPNKRPDITTDTGKKVVVEQMDALADVFIESVARFRDVSTKTVTKDFGRGGILIGEHAVKAGMADRLGSFEQLLNETGGKTMPGKSAEATMTVDTVKTDHPKVYDAIHAIGAESVQAEHSQTIAQKDETIKELENTLATVKDENTTLSDRVGSLEKADALRSEKDTQLAAEAIVSDQLSASTLPARTHSKVKKYIAYDEFVVEGSLDKEKFGAHVASEISDWEETLSSNSSVQGFGTNLPKEEKEDKEEAKVVADLLEKAGVTE